LRYSVVFPCAFAFFHLKRAAAAILALAAGDIFLRPLPAGFVETPRFAAHRAFAAAAIAARPAALILLPRRVLVGAEASEKELSPSKPANSF